MHAWFINVCASHHVACTFPPFPTAEKDAWDADSDDEKKAEAATAEKSAAAAPTKPKKKSIKQVCLSISRPDGV